MNARKDKNMEPSLSFYITALQKNFTCYATHKLKEAGLNFGQLPFVLYVGKHPGCTPSEVTREIHMDWGHTQRSLERLTEDGFIKKERKHPNSRICDLFLTEKGEEAFKAAHDVFYSWDSENLSFLPEDEVKKVTAILERVLEETRKKITDDLI